MMGKKTWPPYFALVLLICCLQLSMAIDTNTNNMTDLSALLAFKAQNNFHPFIAKNWSTATSFCNWFGVSCSSNKERVVGLDLYSMHLNGTIPSQVGNLSCLVRLDLSYNSLHGPLPKELGNLRNLRYINLSNNSFYGDIPSELTMLPLLQDMILANNSLTGEIPEEIGNLFNLEILALQVNSLNGSIPGDVGNCTSLKQILINRNFLTGTIPREIGNITLLQIISMDRNNLTGTIPQEIGNLQNLQIVHLSFNKLKGSIPSSIFNISTMNWIALTSNNLSGNLPSTLGLSLPNIIWLYLSINELTGPIPPSICNASKLEILELAQNSFFGSIPECFGTLKYLETLKLAHNLLATKNPFGELSFLSSLTNCQNLVYLWFAHNPLLEGYLPISTGNLSDSLEYFIARLIPYCFNNLTSLRDLFLASNNFIEIENLKVVILIDISENELSGQIPTTIGGNKGLCGLPRLEVATCINNRNIRASKKLSQLFLRYILPSFIFTVLILVIIIFHRFKRKAKLKDPESFLRLEKWRRISYRELEFATNGFQESNFLGVGSFGKVYKGTLSDGTIIAIKVFNMQLEKGFKSFEKECDVLRNLRHRNLVKVVSSCCNLDFKALVIEFMPNGSLEKWLYSENYFLDVLQRLNIMVNVASALEYIHHGCVMPVVHCDIKPSNVLLNEEKVGFVADFGIAKLLSEGDSVKQTITLATIGYMAPEYGSEGLVSMKCDVYSYGILLMETFTRKKPTDELFSEEMSLKQWVEQSLSYDITQALDANLISEEEEEQHFVAKMDCITSILKLALQCSTILPQERLDMKDVVVALKKIKKKFLEDIEP
ncbi:hypothetical protein JCGZ_01909 [Jatropha curcas]|uniref:non-specific serine/threonine protein kinase n=1 Tax=Jatropha curcas TaxID=180498 RepID=A0A067L0X6_JATCU|nr:hypothetical protein JCGZ_01909 [Jatropha curcas]